MVNSRQERVGRVNDHVQHSTVLYTVTNRSQSSSARPVVEMQLPYVTCNVLSAQDSGILPERCQSLVARLHLVNILVVFCPSLDPVDVTKAYR